MSIARAFRLDEPEYLDLDPIPRENPIWTRAMAYCTVVPELTPHRVTYQLTLAELRSDPDFTSEMEGVLYRNHHGKPVITSVGQKPEPYVWGRYLGTWLQWCAVPPNLVLVDGAEFALSYRFTGNSGHVFVVYFDQYNNGLRLVWH